MTRARLVVLLVIIGGGGLAALLPITRDELSWCWATSHNRAADYLEYSTYWPRGLHAGQSKILYERRLWTETKKALIRDAYQESSPANSQADLPYQKALRLRQESFLWKQATNVDTVQCYQKYLRKYPMGRFAKEARLRVNALSAPSAAPAPTPAPSP